MFSKKEIRKEKKLYAMNILVFWFEVKIFDNKFLITILKYWNQVIFKLKNGRLINNCVFSKLL